MKKGRVGRMRKDLDLSRVTTISFNRRKTLRALARALDVSKTTLHRRFQWGELERCTSPLKPILKPANKIERLKFCMLMLDENPFTYSDHYFKEMDNFFHIDEKWFNMTQKKQHLLSSPWRSYPPPYRAK
jgi:AraC-like DNA-binding protein